MIKYVIVPVQSMGRYWAREMGIQRPVIVSCIEYFRGYRPKMGEAFGYPERGTSIYEVVDYLEGHFNRYVEARNV